MRPDMGSNGCGKSRQLCKQPSYVSSCRVVDRGTVHRRIGPWTSLHLAAALHDSFADGVPIAHRDRRAGGLDVVALPTKG